MSIKDVTISEISTIMSMFSGEKKEYPFRVGGKYFFRTVTQYVVGEITEIKGSFIKMEDAAWIADTGRYSEFLKEGNPKEFEAYPNGCYLNLESVIDCADWDHSLPIQEDQS